MKSYNIFRIVLFLILAIVTSAVTFLLTAPPFSAIFWILFGFGIWGELLLCSLPLNFQNRFFPGRAAILGGSVILYAICLIIACICGALMSDSKALLAVELLILIIPGIGFCISSFAVALQNHAIKQTTLAGELFKKISQEASDIDFQIKNDDNLKDFRQLWQKFHENLLFSSRETYRSSQIITEKILLKLQQLKSIIAQQEQYPQCKVLIAEISHLLTEREKLCKNGEN